MDVELCNAGQSTALMWAANTGHSAVCSQLLALGADPTVANERGSTPCMHVVMSFASRAMNACVPVLRRVRCNGGRWSAARTRFELARGSNFAPKSEMDLR